MPDKCCVPKCTANYAASKTGTSTSTSGYVSVFSFPKDEKMKQKWIKAIHRESFIPTKHSVVCIKHFSESCIIRVDVMTRPDGSILEVSRKVPKLAKAAVPSIFPNQPSYLSKKSPLKRKHPDERRQDLVNRDEANFQQWACKDNILNFETVLDGARKVKLKQLKQENEVCALCFGLSGTELQAVTTSITTSPLAKELDNFSFIEVQIGYKLPERICEECLKKLNYVGSFIQMCKHSLTIYTEIEEQQIKSQGNELQELSKETCESVGQVKDELQELSNETCESVGQVKDELQELPNETCESVGQVKDELQVTEAELNIPDALLDHSYHKVDTKIKKDKTPSKMKACPTCDEKVPILSKHYRNQPHCQPKRIPCSMCTLRFITTRMMRRHQRIQHADQVPITLSMCHICSKTFKYEANLRRHLRVHKYGKLFMCEQCGKSYTTAAHLRGHQNMHLNLKPHLCADCGKQFYTSTALYIHNRQVHKKLYYKSGNSNVRGNVVRKNDHELIPCNICDRSFTPFGLKMHIRTHDEDYYCQKCKIEFETVLQYRRHLKIHVKKDAECPYCFNKYSRYTLKHHIKIHTEERQFSCPECSRKFRTHTHLKNHRLAIHHVNRGTPWKCKFCNQSFTFSANLRAHERLHTGEKPYPCHVCDEAFSDSKKRKKHVAQMHGEDEVQNINYMN